jgi:hypothetical protein
MAEPETTNATTEKKKQTCKRKATGLEPSFEALLRAAKVTDPLYVGHR